MNYEVPPTVANEAMDRCDELLRIGKIDERYLQGMKDAFGWVLGHYEIPGALEELEPRREAGQ